MPDKTFSTMSRLKTARRIQHSLFKSNVFRALSIFSVLAIVAASFMISRQIMTNAQAQQAAGIPQTASLAEANAISSIKQTSAEVVSEQPESVSPTVPNGGAGCGWTAGTVYPIPVLDNAAVTVGTNLYSFAGVSGTIIANSYRFDGTAWTAIAPLPEALESPAAASDGTNIYIVGGANGVGDAVNTLYRYNVASNTYTTLAPAPTATWNSAAVFLGGKIYKITGFTSVGGTSGGTTAVEIYDIASNTWTAGPAYPVSVGFVSAFVQGGSIYAAGGVNITSGTGSVKTYRYVTASNTWDDAAIADLPADRWGAATAVYNGEAVLAGGFVAGAVSNTVIEYDLASNAWTTLPNMLQARGRFAGAVAAGSFFAIGGRSAAGGFAGTNDNQKLFCPDPTQPFIQGTVTYVSDNGTPANNVPDPGETVTVSLSLQNLGGANTGSNVTATLLSTGGITNPSAPQTYGTIAANATVARNFTFTVPAGAACGSQITLTFNVTDGATTTTVTRTFTLGVLQAVFTENFDTVTPPALPAGWTNVQTGSNTGWVTTATTPDTAPNSVFAPDLATPGGADLTSPAVTISTATATLNFRIRFNTESTYDGAVLEISIPNVNGGAYQDILTAGGTFVTGGYTGTIRGTGNPLLTDPVRQGWTGNSNGYISSSVRLPAAANGQAVRFRWRVGNDDSVAPAGGGVNIDTVAVNGSFLCSTVGGGTAPTNTRSDFDGDGKTDFSVFRPSNGTWYAQRSTSGFFGIQYGVSTDTILSGDFDGDNRTDFAIYRPSATAADTDFYFLRSTNNTLGGASWGQPGDVPKTGDFDGDNRDDLAIYRSSNNTWYVLLSGGGTSIVVTNLAAAGGVPIVLDYDGDGRADLASWNSTTGVWTIRQSSNTAVVTAQWGQTGDILVPADYDNDNRDDLAVFRAGVWYVRRSTTGVTGISYFGTTGDVPVPGDYDGDGDDDVAVFRSGTWYVITASNGFTSFQFGLSGDTAVPSVFTAQ